MLEKLEELLLETGLDQDELEQSAGLAKNRISKWKGGQGEPTAAQALRMARILNVPLVYLVDDELEEIPQPDLTREERFLIDRLRNQGIDPGEALDAAIRAKLDRGGVYQPAGLVHRPPKSSSVRQPRRDHKRAKNPDVPNSRK